MNPHVNPAAPAVGSIPATTSTPAKSRPIHIVTVNATASGSFKTFLTAASAHIVLAQEVKTSGESSERLKAKGAGWKN